MQALDIIVKYQASAYVTNTYCGIRSSCTSGAQSAAELQGRKLFGEGFVRAEHLHDISPGTQAWRLFSTTGQG